MMETMVSAIVDNIDADLKGEPATRKATWNAICLADMGGTSTAEPIYERYILKLLGIERLKR
jgi:hypothetical protein